MDEETRQRLSDAAQDVREHFDQIEQDVPDQSFVVGGFVRDTIMGLEPNDMDFVVVGESLESMKDRGFEPIEASSFPVLHDSEHEEWALARTEQKTGDGYTGFEVFTDDVSLPEDLSRRDLTINSLAIDPFGENQMGVIEDGDSWNLAAPMGSNGYEQPLQDIQNGVLRHTSDAFSEDPLRVLRVSRYAARFAVPTNEKSVEFVEKEDGSIEESLHQFACDTGNAVHAGFQVADETMDMMRQVAPELNRMSRDRIGDEIVKAMRQSRRPSRFFEVLRDSGALAVLWPELDRAEVVLAGPPEHHFEGSLFNHLMMVLDRMHRLCIEQNIDGHDRVRRLLMAVSHDIGKVVSADNQCGIHSDDPPTGFPGHANIGANVVPDTARRLGLSAEFEGVMQDACSKHMIVHDVPMMRPAELLEFFEENLGPDPTSRTLPLGAERENGERTHVSFHRATAWEVVDLACADHEGRLKRIMSDPIEGTDLVRTSVDRPEFDREPFERSVEAVIEAKQVDGHEALETGLCDEHADSEIDTTNGIHVDEDKRVPAVMSDCPDCRTPGGWVGDVLQSMRVENLQEVLTDDE